MNKAIGNNVNGIIPPTFADDTINKVEHIEESAVPKNGEESSPGN